MSDSQRSKDGFDLDLPLGLIIGLLGGVVAGILFAPKPGKELQDDVQQFINKLPDELSDQLSASKVRYKEMVGKTKATIETNLEKRNQRKQALRMAEAKRREELETGSYEY